MIKKILTWIGKHKVLTIVLALILGAAGCFFVNRNNTSGQYAETALSEHSLITYNSFVGTVEPDSSVRIIPKVSSLVTSVSVKEGDHVNKGQVIAVLDDTAAQYQIALKQASMNQAGTSSYYNIKEAETAYQNYRTALENGLNSSMISAGRSLNSARTSLEQAEDSRDLGMESADNAYRDAKEKAERAKREAEWAGMQLPSQFEISRITNALAEAEAAKTAAETAYNTAVQEEQLAYLEYEAAPEGTPEKEEKYRIWTEKMEAETAAKQVLEQKDAEYQSAKAAYDSISEKISAFETAMKAYETELDTLDKAELSYEETKMKYDNAVTNAENEVAAASISYDSTALAVQQQLKSYEDTITKIRANSVDQTGKVEMSHLQDALKDYTITAPAAGTITSLSLIEGEVAANNSVCAVISGLDVMKIKIKVDEYSVLNTETGKPVTIYIDPIGSTYEGTITYISDTAEVVSGVSYYNAEVSFIPDEKVRGGMSTEVRLVNVNVPSAMCLPAEAIQYRADNSPYVLVKDGKGIGERDIVTGPSDGSYVQVLEGIRGEDTVLYPITIPSASVTVSGGA